MEENGILRKIFHTSNTSHSLNPFRLREQKTLIGPKEYKAFRFAFFGEKSTLDSPQFEKVIDSVTKPFKCEDSVTESCNYLEKATNDASSQYIKNSKLQGLQEEICDSKNNLINKVPVESLTNRRMIKAQPKILDVFTKVCLIYQLS